MGVELRGGCSCRRRKSTLERIWRIKTQTCATLREHRLEYASMVDAVATTNRRVAGSAEDPPEETILESRAPRETKARFDVVFIVFVNVVDAIFGFLRHGHVLIS